MTTAREKVEHFQARALIGAVDDQSLLLVKKLIEQNCFNPNSKNSQGYSVVHYCSGVEYEEFANTVLLFLIENGANIHDQTNEELFTPLHIAVMNDRTIVTKTLLKSGANFSPKDADDNTPIYYAIANAHPDMIELIQSYIFMEMQKAKQMSQQKTDQSLLQSVQMSSICEHERNLTPGGANAAFLECDISDKSLTPTRIVYIRDRASPFYVNITHRKKLIPAEVYARCSNPKPISNNASEDIIENINVFALTQDNLNLFSESIRESGRFDMFQKWQQKINEHKFRLSTGQIENVRDDIVGFIGEDEQFAEDLFTEDETFVTAESPSNESTISGESILSETKFLKSPKANDCVAVWEECYKHTDDEERIVFYEKKVTAVNIKDRQPDKQSVTSASSFSTKLDTDYDTDALRNELTQFGDVPGPITKSTKKLYLRRLQKYKRNPENMQIMITARIQKQLTYSLELEKSFTVVHEGCAAFAEFFMYEKEMSDDFNLSNGKTLREGSRKMSFIYLLLDPRVLENMAANQVYISKESAWRRFLNSIFYVGKGKKSRPYAHLYNALRYFAEGEKENITAFARQPNAIEPSSSREQLLKKQFDPSKLDEETIKALIKHKIGSCENKKLAQILDIWANKQGVVCLHVFHNLIPTEAYTREAAIIDAIGLGNLTNQKRGDYYGVAQSWTLRKRKQLGVALLYKAMQIHLIEGESQLMPNDLI